MRHLAHGSPSRGQRHMQGRNASRHRDSRRGIAAVEFALTLPIWVTLLLGAADGTYCMLVNEKTDRIAYSVTDIVTQYTAISTANLNDIVLAASQLMLPFTFGANGIVIVTSVYQPSGGTPHICWQYTGGGTLGGSTPSKIGTDNGSSTCASGTAAALPNGLTINDNDNVVITEVYYKFSPMFLSAGLFTAGNIYRVAVYKPRLSPLVTRPS